MDIELEFPPAPDIANPDVARRREDFNRWYATLKTCLLRQFEQMAEVVDRKADKN